MNVEITFTWWRERNPRDYKVTERMPDPPGQSMLDAKPVAVNVSRIVAKGACLDRYHPLDEFPALWEHFARVKKGEDAINFVRTYGPVSREGLRGKGDIIEEILREAEDMRDHVVGAVLSKLSARVDHGQLKIGPNNLLDAMWLQYAKAKSEGRANRCPQCKQIFATGPEVGRGKGAKFCSEECKVKFHSLKRSRQP